MSGASYEQQTESFRNNSNAPLHQLLAGTAYTALIGLPTLRFSKNGGRLYGGWGGREKENK